jgi:calcineurin-like phosphoesterase family protein
LFFTADTHFGHRAVIKYGKRPFADVDEMDAELIRRWNVVVPTDGIVYHLGDVSFRKNAATVAILKRLNGCKHLIQGNHDHLNAETKAQFVDIADYRELKIDGRKIVLCHYPLENPVSAGTFPDPIPINSRVYRATRFLLTRARISFCCSDARFNTFE